jgi:hypothetical protein
MSTSNDSASLGMLANADRPQLPPDIVAVARPIVKRRQKTSGGAPPGLFSPKIRASARAEIVLPVPQTPSAEPDSSEKRELLMKFEMIRRRNPDSDVPDFSMKSDVSLMRTTYDLLISKIVTGTTVDTYKQYLLYGSILIEIGAARFTSINMDGFTAHHQSMMDSYEKLFIELGEKCDPGARSRLPVEIRLALVLGVNSLVFVVARIGFSPEVASRFLRVLAPAKKTMRRPDE